MERYRQDVDFDRLARLETQLLTDKIYYLMADALWRKAMGTYKKVHDHKSSIVQRASSSVLFAILALFLFSLRLSNYISLSYGLTLQLFF